MKRTGLKAEKEKVHPLPANLPIVGICGFSGAGKTTVIELILPDLLTKGLRVAVVKHDCCNIRMDKPGKDSYRLYQAGADVFLLGGEETHRLHCEYSDHFFTSLTRLAMRYDLVLVEGHGKSPVPKLWMLSENEIKPPTDVDDIMEVFPRKDRRERVLQAVMHHLADSWQKTPIYGCVLIGGQSRRMGRPKHLIQRQDGKLWLQHAIGLLSSYTDRVVLSGSGLVPDDLSNISRLPDIVDLHGPLSGILSAMRWQPNVSWILLACDMPYASPEAVKWLLSQRKPGVWGIVPADQTGKRYQPLLAYYDSRCVQFFEKLYLSGSERISEIVKEDKIASPVIPEAIAQAWTNVNTPEQLAKEE